MNSILKKVNRDMLFRIGIIVFWSLTIICEGLYWFLVLKSDVVVNTEGHIWLIVPWIYRLFMFVITTVAKGKINCKILWIVWGYLMFCFIWQLCMNGPLLVEQIRSYVRWGGDSVYDDLVKFEMFWNIANTITNLLFGISYIPIIFKKRNKKIMVLQLGCWGLIAVISIFPLFTGMFSVIRHVFVWRLFSYLQTIFWMFTSILFWWWIMLKKECKLKENIMVVNVTKVLKCPTCGEKVEADDCFCSMCGYRLKKEPE